MRLIGNGVRLIGDGKPFKMRKDDIIEKIKECETF